MEIKNGDKVEYIGTTQDQYTPPAGTIGIVLETDGGTTLVRWAQGTTSGDGAWWAETSMLKFVQSSQCSDCSGALLVSSYTHDERVAFLRKLDAFARDRLDESYFINHYLAIAIPDGSSDEDFEEYAEDATLIMDTLYEIVNGIVNNYIEEEH